MIYGYETNKIAIFLQDVTPCIFTFSYTPGRYFWTVLPEHKTQAWGGGISTPQYFIWFHSPPSKYTFVFKSLICIPPHVKLSSMPLSVIEKTFLPVPLKNSEPLAFLIRQLYGLTLSLQDIITVYCHSGSFTHPSSIFTKVNRRKSFICALCVNWPCASVSLY